MIDLNSLQDSIAPVVCRQLAVPQPWFQWAVIATIALPHFFYAWLWFFPGPWKRLCGDKAVDAFAVMGTFGKLLQFEAVLLWVWSARPQGLCLDTSSIELWQWLAFLLFVSFGQKLNVGIFQAIGVPGVYYGCKLGKDVPWVTGFPFNVVSHPQYVGSAMTVWGFGSVLYSQMPSQELRTSVVILSVYWTLLYVASALIEQYL